MKVLCAFGKYQYGRKERGLSHEYQHFIPALENIGYQVHLFDSYSKRHTDNLSKLNSELLFEVDLIKPDLFFSVHWDYEIWVETIDLISSHRDVTTVTWSTDDSWKYKQASRFWGHHYHAVATTYPGRIKDYQRDGINQVFLTQWGVSRNFLKPPIAALNCEYQVSFVGSANRDRINKIESLKRAGINVSCFGKGWPSGPVETDHLRHIINNSIISLNFNTSQGDNQIKARCFEIPACGGFLLTENASDIGKYYVIGQDIDTFFKHNELVDKVRFYLNHPGRRDEISLSGFRRTEKEHVYEVRFTDLFEFANSNKSKWFAKNRGQKYISINMSCIRHKRNWCLNLLRILLIGLGTILFGYKRGRRAARRLAFEFSWRIVGEKTYYSTSWVGRMFPAEH